MGLIFFAGYDGKGVYLLWREGKGRESERRLSWTGGRWKGGGEGRLTNGGRAYSADGVLCAV